MPIGNDESNEIYVDVDTGSHQLYLGLFVLATLLSIYLYNQNTASDKTNLRNDLTNQQLQKENNRLREENIKMEAAVQVKVSQLDQVRSANVTCNSQLNEASAGSVKFASQLSQQAAMLEKI